MGSTEHVSDRESYLLSVQVGTGGQSYSSEGGDYYRLHNSVSMTVHLLCVKMTAKCDKTNSHNKPQSQLGKSRLCMRVHAQDGCVCTRVCCVYVFCAFVGVIEDSLHLKAVFNFVNVSKMIMLQPHRVIRRTVGHKALCCIHKYCRDG